MLTSVTFTTAINTDGVVTKEALSLVPSNSQDRSGAVRVDGVMISCTGLYG